MVGFGEDSINITAQILIAVIYELITIIVLSFGI
jgi:hypothetical protein